MKYKKVTRWVLVFLALFVLATAVKAYIFNFRITKPNDPPYSPLTHSSAESKKRGIWICDVAIEPQTINMGQREFQLREAWIEASYDEDFHLDWFTKRERKDWNWLCVRVPPGIYLLGAASPSQSWNLCYKKLSANDFGDLNANITFRDSEKEHYVGQVTLKPVRADKK
ncbi:MAG: hypothetical protein L0215_19650 [Gemmataceae bacterium]|nr:hypothetical protein [Gemmataceae bacterium]